jgi:hypothetical protein
MAISYILWPFGNVVVIWYIFPHFGILYKEKSGNPAFDGSSSNSNSSRNSLVSSDFPVNPILWRLRSTNFYSTLFAAIIWFPSDSFSCLGRV